MGTVSVSLPSDGQTIDAADYNTPINTIVTAINGNLDSDNINEGGVVPNSLLDGTGTSWVWQSWTPTLTNFTLGSGTVDAKYIQIGKTVIFRLKFTLASGSAVGSAGTFSTPVTASSAYGTNTTIGDAVFDEAGVGTFLGYIRLDSTTTLRPIIYNAATTYVGQTGVASTVPFTWGTGDVISLTGVYEAA